MRDRAMPPLPVSIYHLRQLVPSPHSEEEYRCSPEIPHGTYPSATSLYRAGLYSSCPYQRGNAGLLLGHAVCATATYAMPKGLPVEPQERHYIVPTQYLLKGS